MAYSRIICGRRRFRKKPMGCSRSGCATIWTFARSISFPPHGKRACLSFLASCGKRGKRRLNKSRLLARSGCSTTFLSGNLPPKSRPWAWEAPLPERPTISGLSRNYDLHPYREKCHHQRGQKSARFVISVYGKT